MRLETDKVHSALLTVRESPLTSLNEPRKRTKQRPSEALRFILVTNTLYIPPLPLCMYPHSIRVLGAAVASEAAFAAWGRWCFASQPFLDPCDDRRCHASSVHSHSHFHSPPRVPSSNSPHFSSSKKLARSSGTRVAAPSMPPEWRGQCRRHGARVARQASLQQTLHRRGL